jgi:outer membrane protein assembly factor BamB
MADADTTNYIVSYTSTGTLRWDYSFGMRVFDSHGSYALSDDGATIYCSGLNGLTAINTSDGSLKWENNVGTTKGGCVVANGDVVIGLFNTGDATTVAVADNGTTGTVVWTVGLGAADDSWSFPSLLPNGDVVVAGQHGQVMRIDVIPEPGMFAILSLALLALIRRT